MPHVRMHRDPSQRPTAREALTHPWLRSGSAGGQTTGKSLASIAVPRTQVRTDVKPGKVQKDRHGHPP